MSGEAARLAAARRSDRQSLIAMGAVFGGVFLLGVVLAWAIVATEPQRRAAYMATCQEKGFTQEPCRFLYAERREPDSDAAAAIGLGLAALAVSASRR